MFGHILTKDKRDKNFPISSILPSEDTPLVYKKWKIGEINNQGNSSQCVAYASDLILRSAPKIQQSPGTELLYKESCIIDGLDHSKVSGTTLRAMMKVLQNRNLIRAYYWAKDIEDIAKYLCTVGPLIFGTKWFEGMSKPDDFGFSNITGVEVGNHAYLCYGVDVEKGHLLFANSYGLFWGQNGCFKMRFEEVSWLLKQDGLCVAPQEIDVKF
jgi:hypothetical protein